MANRRDLETRLIATDNASKVIDKVADDLDRLEKKGETKLEIDVDDKASKEIDDVDDKLDKLSKADRKVILDAQAKDAQRDIDRILRSLKDVDRMDRQEVDIRVEALGNARAELEAIEREVRDLDNETVDVKVDADTSTFRGKVSAFRSDLSGASGALGKLGVAGKAAFSALGPYAVEAGAVAATAIATFVTKATTDFQKLALEVGHARDSLGLTADEASRLKEVSEDMGVPFKTLETAIGRMNKVAGNTPGPFQAIGAEIATTDEGTIDVNATFLNVIDTLNQIPDAGARAAAGSKIFGKGWAQVAEMVDIGLDGVQQRLAEVGEGKLVSDEQIAQARELRDNVDNLGDRLEEFSNTIGREVAPVVSDLAAGLGAVLDVSGELFKVLQGDFDIPVLSQAVRYMNPLTGGFNAVTDAIGAAKQELDDFTGVTHGSVGAIATLSDGLTDEERAAAQAQAALDRLQAQTAETYESATEGAERLENLSIAEQKAADKTQAHVDALQAEADLLDEQAAAFKDAADLTRDLNKLRQRQRELAKDENATIEDRVDLAIELADTEAQRIEAIRKAAGETVSATDKIDAQNHALIDQAAQLRGPSRTSILNYIGNLNGIPPRKLSRIEALIAAGKLDAAKRLLDETSASRTATITADVDRAQADADLADLTQPRYFPLFPQLQGPRANGGTVGPRGEVALVGERGPELVALPGGSHVYPAAQTAGMLRNAGASTVANVTINAAVIGNTYDVQRTVRSALRGSERLNGKRPYQ